MTSGITEDMKAPWTDEQVKSLNEYQYSQVMHPFTCPNNHLTFFTNIDMNTEVHKDHIGTWTLADIVSSHHICLVARNDGWFCPSELCDYTQDWAHPGMLDGSWQALVEGFYSSLE